MTGRLIWSLFSVSEKNNMQITKALWTYISHHYSEGKTACTVLCGGQDPNLAVGMKLPGGKSHLLLLPMLLKVENPTYSAINSNKDDNMIHFVL